MASKAQKKRAKDAFLKTKITVKPIIPITNFIMPEDRIIYEKETILPDDYPICWNYVYLIDGKPTRSYIEGTVLDLKRNLEKAGKIANEVRRCDLSKRGLL